MLVIAHRGANREALENSWQAFELAIAGGCQRIELDVHLSRDGEVVVNHDDNLLKSTGHHIEIASLTRQELKKIQLLNGEPIPFLDEVIEKILPRCQLNIELKGESVALAQKVAQLLTNYQRPENIVLSSFAIEPLKWLKEYAPKWPRACLMGHDTFSWPFFAYVSPLVFMADTRSNIAHPEASLVTENFMDQAKHRGWLVYPWVPIAGEEHDREGLWSYLYTLGVDGLCTNYPRQLGLWLQDLQSDHLYAPIKRET